MTLRIHIFVQLWISFPEELNIEDYIHKCNERPEEKNDTKL